MDIVEGKTQFSWHLFRSGIYNVGHCVMTCWVWLSECEQGSSFFFFQQTQYSNKSCVSLRNRSKRGPSLRATRDGPWCHSISSSMSRILARVWLDCKNKVRKRTKHRSRYNQAPHLSQDTNGKVTTSQLDITNESQKVSPFQAGDHKASTNRRAWKHNKRIRK